MGTSRTRGGRADAGFGRFAATLRHLPLAQVRELVLHRLRWMARKRFPRLCEHALRKRFESEWPTSDWNPECRPQTHSLPEEALRRLADFRAGKIEVLNRIESFTPGRFWDLAERGDNPPLVRETLHYQAFLVEFGSLLATEQGAEVLELLESILSAWRERFPPGHRVAWQPFTVAYRAQCWLRLHALLRESSDQRAEPVAETLRRDLFRHGLFLETNLERHLGGNHLFKDYCALAMLAGFFRGPTADRWLALVRTELPQQIGIQVLADGGHYERSPMYHILGMGDLLDAALALSARDVNWVNGHLLAPLERMARFLSGILHGDGEIPLFNDSVLGQAPSPAEMFQRLQGSGLFDENLTNPLKNTLFTLDPRFRGGDEVKKHAEIRHSRESGNPGGTTNGLFQRTVRLETEGDGLDHFPDTGYTRFRSGGLCLVFDHGRLGPDELMGHVHNDTLSFELSWGADRFIVDRGVYEYTTGARREECRAIRSHNTPAVDGLAQAETWAAFRVGRRWHAEGGCLERFPEGEGVAARWSRPGMPAIERRVVRLDTGVFGITDRIGPGGARRIEIPFHFGPGVEVEVLELEPRDGKRGGSLVYWTATKGSKRLWGAFSSLYPFEVSLSETTCWPRFHVEENIARLAVSLEVETPARIVTMIAPGEIEIERWVEFCLEQEAQQFHAEVSTSAWNWRAIHPRSHRPGTLRIRRGPKPCESR